MALGTMKGELRGGRVYNGIGLFGSLGRIGSDGTRWDEEGTSIPCVLLPLTFFSVDFVQPIDACLRSKQERGEEGIY